MKPKYIYTYINTQMSFTFYVFDLSDLWRISFDQSGTHLHM